MLFLVFSQKNDTGKSKKEIPQIQSKINMKK